MTLDMLFPSIPKDPYRQIYFEAVDLIVQSITERFNQPGYKVYLQLENLLIKAAKKENYDGELQFLSTFYGADINKTNLQLQLDTFAANLASICNNFTDIRDQLLQISPAERMLMDEVMTIMKLIMVMPATNASSERSFSAMRRVKSYLRSTMKQERLNHLMLLHVHKELTDTLNLADVANDFVSSSENRLRVFGNFK